ncbi:MULTISPECIES: DUF3231 family protein [unclassified Paenibacillus]|uniref:DUF3231 family protein n=1 Tax=unclassified Paenibacillus TaxID=185978 RepID=UPI001AE4C14C|nr:MULTISPECIES: DUF3231 family protein [unclassified Paenibacillus]MBP1155087.1 hypothetical protein [Paenibacillus sp. PvP091]MBP1169529.1 hypothetical protein [Paenibacillus sp. PvR098]MBP2440557.1 hypothetical protein [Paenibacillus sp. PvP052]
MNFFEIIKDTFKPFLDGEKPPLHVGEVMNLWFYLTGTEQTLRVDQVSYNVVQDPELKGKLEDIINNIHKPMINELTEFLKKEGISLPKSSPEKPIGDYRTIPEGAKMSDEEIANLLAYNLVIGITSAVRGLTESVRADVGMMFAKNQMMKVTYSLTLKDLMVKRGWIKVPPYYFPGGNQT